MSVPILVVNNDTHARRQMRQALEVAGYSVVEADDAETGLATLRASERSMVVLFNVAMHGNMMPGTDGIAFLGAAAGDAHLAHMHAFVIVTPTPAQLEAALGRLLDHLGIPVVTEPLAKDDLLRVVAKSMWRLLVSA